MTRTAVALALLLALVPAVPARADGVIASKDAVACKDGKSLFELTYQKLDPERYFATGTCVHIAGWHFRVVGEVGRYGASSEIVAGPAGDAAPQTWFTLNKWVQFAD